MNSITLSLSRTWLRYGNVVSQLFKLEWNLSIHNVSVRTQSSMHVKFADSSQLLHVQSGPFALQMTPNGSRLIGRTASWSRSSLKVLCVAQIKRQKPTNVDRLISYNCSRQGFPPKAEWQTVCCTQFSWLFVCIIHCVKLLRLFAVSCYDSCLMIVWITLTNNVSNIKLMFKHLSHILSCFRYTSFVVFPSSLPYLFYRYFTFVSLLSIFLLHSLRLVCNSILFSHLFHLQLRFCLLFSHERSVVERSKLEAFVHHFSELHDCGQMFVRNALEKL